MKLIFVVFTIVFACHIPSLTAADEFLMVSPGAELFSETFEEGSISERWGIKQFFIIEDGVLKRSTHQPQESARIFLKEAAFHDVIIQFDFKFEGSSELRLVTGGGGGYNTITQVSTKHFQVNTAKRKLEFQPSHQGECAIDFEQGKWYTMTVEFEGSEVAAHLDGEHFVIGKHPIIDTERTYIALQVEGTSAHFDNFKIWKSVPKPEWESVCKELATRQKDRGAALNRSVFEEEKLLSLKLKDRLSRTDKTYQQLVAQKVSLESSLKADYPKAYQSHKELSKSTAKKKSALKNEPRYQETRKAISQAGKAIRAYVHAKHPDLEGLPKHLYYARFEACKAAMQKDPGLVKLEDALIQREREQKLAFPEAFVEVEVLVEKRRKYAMGLNRDPAFRERKRELADAVHAVEDYVLSIEPRLEQLKEAIQAAKKKTKEKK